MLQPLINPNLTLDLITFTEWRYLHGQLSLALVNDPSSVLVRESSAAQGGGGFVLKPPLLLHLYTSAAPCGAASLGTAAESCVGGSHSKKAPAMFKGAFAEETGAVAGGCEMVADAEGLGAAGRHGVT